MNPVKLSLKYKIKIIIFTHKQKPRVYPPGDSHRRNAYCIHFKKKNDPRKILRCKDTGKHVGKSQKKNKNKNKNKTKPKNKNHT